MEDSLDGCASPSYDLYSDLLVEDEEKNRREAAAFATASVDGALREEIASLRTANSSLKAQNSDLATRLTEEEKTRAGIEQKFLAFRYVLGWVD